MAGCVRYSVLGVHRASVACAGRQHTLTVLAIYGVHMCTPGTHNALPWNLADVGPQTLVYYTVAVQWLKQLDHNRSP